VYNCCVFEAKEQEIPPANVDTAWAIAMNKRTFIRRFAALLASPVISPLLAWASKIKLKNWAGNLEYSTDRLYSANSLEQVQSYVKKQSKLKVLGTRHCFNNIADSTHNFLFLKSMDDVVVLEPEAHTVTVHAGMTYGQLCPYLDSKGYALHNLASLPHISIAGACSTATHGSGEKNGNLATAVSALEIVTAAGEVVKLSRLEDGDAFLGAVVGLGALGVITKITLDIQPTFLMRQYVYENLPLNEVKNHFDAIESSAYSVSLFTDWQKQCIGEVWIKSRVEEGQAFEATAEFFGAKRATKNLHPIAELSAENCTEQMGVPGPWYERLPHFRMGFTPSAGKELQSEYFVPRQHSVEANILLPCHSIARQLRIEISHIAKPTHDDYRHFAIRVRRFPHARPAARGAPEGFLHTLPRAGTTVRSFRRPPAGAPLPGLGRAQTLARLDAGATNPNTGPVRPLSSLSGHGLHR